ncbi:hypothetical protein IFM89_038005 [Coptis chinensis]|uniref:Uncharacterized protein n=1 Tax=Coptis chinensis TaxID=261450 RepID=A0A835M639_9MAGN|nr:hypothetical protein IFM89_038005 [Coptis chinensis]
MDLYELENHSKGNTTTQDTFQALQAVNTEKSTATPTNITAIVAYPNGMNCVLLTQSLSGTRYEITIKVGEATVSLVHARSPYVHRRALWDELTTLGINVGAWVVAGNFNVVTMVT